MGPLIAALMAFVRARAGQLALGVGGAALSDVINIDILRQQSVKFAPTSDPEALEEAARMIMRLLGIDGSDVRGPKNIADWNYCHINMRNGQVWWTWKYISAGGQKALIRAITRAPSGVVAGGFRPTGTGGFRGRRF